VKPGTILVVDDEPQIRRAIKATLSAEGYVIIEARDGQEGVLKLQSQHPNLVLLDMNMPIMDGLEACRKMRADFDIPIIMLTVREAEKDKVSALDAGADDYVVKPFSIQELLARIRASLRHFANKESGVTLASKELNFDFEKRLIVVRGQSVHLTPKEFDLLWQLVVNEGRPISHRRLLQSVWGPDYGEETESLRVVVNQLRKKIEADSSKPKYIRTEPWVGYRFVAAGEASDKDADRRPSERSNKSL
jgi:two-component system, OmpR family, KDP operon response regulator KdpE